MSAIDPNAPTVRDRVGRAKCKPSTKLRHSPRRYMTDLLLQPTGNPTQYEVIAH